VADRLQPSARPPAILSGPPTAGQDTSSRTSGRGEVIIASSTDRAGRSGRTNSGAGSPLSILLPYQADWVSDVARFKIGLWARQTGKSFSTAAESVTDCLARKTTWVTLSAGERQALEWMRKAREWAEVCKVALADYVEVRDTAEAVLKSAEITWPNGSRLLAIPANPDTARGYSANLTLDEFAFHENPDAIWRAIYPSISNPLKGVYKIRIVSTPNGQGNRFHDLWVKDNGWSKHKVDIHTAVARGLPANIDELRSGLGDPEGWAQEFECQFLDAAAVLLPYELIATCEDQDSHETAPAEFWERTSPSPLVLGIDFGRKRDLTCSWAVETVGDVSFTREVLTLRNTSTPDQVALLRPRIQRARRVCLDYTGPGVGMGDYLVREFGEWAPDRHLFGKIELCTFSNTLKLEVFSKLRMDFERRCVRIPISRGIREDLHSMHRVTTPSGGVTYRAPHTDDGHADRCTALALAMRAAANPVAAGSIVVPTTGRRAEALAARRFREVVA
jgi:phage FluMu gp28-like protein